VKLILLTFGYCIVSALIPVVNAEAYVAAVAVLVEDAAIWGLAVAAGAGQMVGKLVYYLIGRSSLEWRFVRKKIDSPAWQERLERWRRRIGGDPWLVGGVVLVSAVTGIPPLAIISVLAGQLRVHWALFFVVGLVGRVGRFASMLGLVGALL